MATKKQKRQAALEKRAAFEAEIKRTGLEAQRQDHEHREAQAARSKEDAQRTNRRHKKILDGAQKSGRLRNA
jgi:hypothetical protein